MKASVIFTFGARRKGGKYVVQKRKNKAINKLCVGEILSLSFVCGAYFFEFSSRNLVRFVIAYNFNGKYAPETPEAGKTRMRTAFFTRALCSRLISVAYVTSLGSLRQKPGAFEIFWIDVSISPHLPQFQVYNWNRGSFDSEELLPSKWYVEEKILFRVENLVFADEEFESKWRLYKFPWLKPIYFSEHLKQFLELWNAVKPFRMWKHFGNR